MAKFKNEILRIIGLSLLFLILLVDSPPSYAASNEITVTPLMADGQRITNQQVNLPLDGNIHQLQLSVTNFTNQEAELVLQGAQAAMTETGAINYLPEAIFSGKLPLNFVDLIPQQKLALAAGETRDLSLTLDFQQVTQGEVRGAILVTKDEEAAYTLPVTLVGDEVPASHLAVTKLTGQLTDELPALGITIANPQATYLAKQDINLSVTHKKFFGLMKKTWQVQLSQLDFAPNGQLVYPISLAGQALESGEYTITGTLNQVKVKQNFTVTKKQAQAINEQVPTLKDATFQRLILIVVGLTVMLLLVITVALRQNKKHKHPKESSDHAKNSSGMPGGKGYEKHN